MSPVLMLAVVAVAAIASLFLSTLTFSLRDFNRTRLEEWLVRHDRLRFLDPVADHRADLAFITAVGRLFANMIILLGLLRFFYDPGRRSLKLEYFEATAITLAITPFLSVAIPHALSRYAAAAIVGFFAPMLNVLRLAMLPVAKVMHATDRLVRNLYGASDEPEAEQIEQNILSVVEEGEKEGVVDEQEREMIESVIDFRDTQVGQIMTARPEMVALDVNASLDEVKRMLEESGHSRVPVYDGTLDHIVGVLYARDLLRYIGRPPERFDIRGTIRPAIYVPETKLVQDLLQDFRNQKVHIAIVLDEYGGTAGLVTIEDIFEQLVGDIGDAHDPTEPAMLHRIDEQTLEADARIYIDEFNRETGLKLPDDAGYETLGGYVSTMLGRIPEKGTTFQSDGARFTVIEAEPQRVNRVKIELILHPEPAN